MTLRNFAIGLSMAAAIACTGCVADTSELGKERISETEQTLQSYQEFFALPQATLVFDQYLADREMAIATVSSDAALPLYFEMAPTAVQLQAIENGGFAVEVAPSSIEFALGRFQTGTGHIALNASEIGSHLGDLQIGNVCGDRKVSAILPMAAGGTLDVGIIVITGGPVVGTLTCMVREVIQGACNAEPCITPLPLPAPGGPGGPLEIVGTCMGATVMGVSWCSCEPDGGL